MDKKGTELPIRTIVIVIIILLVLVVTILFVSGQLGRIFEQLGIYTGIAEETAPNLPTP